MTLEESGSGMVLVLSLVVLAFMTAVMLAAWGFGLARKNGGWTDVFWTFGTGGTLAGAALFPMDAAYAPQPRNRVRYSRYRTDCPCKGLKIRRAQFAHHPFLVCEVRVNRRRGIFDFPGNLTHGHGFIAVPGEQGARRV